MSKVFRILVYIFAVIGFVLVIGYFGLRFGWTNTKGIIDNQHDYFKNQLNTNSWKNSEEWSVLKEAIKKDESVINKISKETGVSSRVIIMPLVVEQLRLFYSEREIFKQVFAPLKVLGNQSQFSWGVMGIKQETARKIEDNLKDSSSPWYLGKEYKNILGFKTDNPDKERFDRLTDESDRYYSYLYGALFIKELEKQWQNAGFPIENKPDIISTLYNIGFENSHPNSNPQSGGAEIEIHGITYSFGSLARSFYESDELIDEFPPPTSSPRL